MSSLVTYVGPCMEGGCLRAVTFSGYCAFHSQYLSGRLQGPPANSAGVLAGLWWRESDSPAYQDGRPPQHRRGKRSHQADPEGNPTMSVYEEIQAERRAQDAEWGAAHDDEHSQGDWLSLTHDYLHLAYDAREYRHRMVQVAALAIAAAEAWDRHRERPGGGE